MTNLPTAPRQRPTASKTAQKCSGTGGETLKAELTPVRVRFAFHVEHRGARIPFFNILEPGHPLGFMSSVTAGTLNQAGYQLVEEFA